MKILIWFIVLFVASLLQVSFQYAGIMLGGIPVFLIYAVAFWIARTLCKVWKEHSENKKELKYCNKEFQKRFGHLIHPYTGKNVSTVQEYLDVVDSQSSGTVIYTKEKKNIYELDKFFRDRFSGYASYNINTVRDYLAMFDQQQKDKCNTN